MKMEWKQGAWRKFLHEAQQAPTRLMTRGCKKIKATTNRDAYLKKRKALEKGEERRVKIKQVFVWDCEGVEVPDNRPKPKAETSAGEPIDPEVRQIVDEIELAEGMTQQEQEELITRETERLTAELGEDRKTQRSLKIRIGRKRKSATTECMSPSNKKA